MSMSDELYCVWLWFADGSYLKEGENLGAEAAVRLVKQVTERVAARMGIIERITLVDSGDLTAFEWTFGKGVTFPTPFDKADEYGNITR